MKTVTQGKVPAVQLNTPFKYLPQTKLPKISWCQPKSSETFQLPTGELVDLSHNAILDDLVYVKKKIV